MRPLRNPKPLKAGFIESIVVFDHGEYVVGPAIVNRRIEDFTGAGDLLAGSVAAGFTTGDEIHSVLQRSDAHAAATDVHAAELERRLGVVVVIRTEQEFS